MAESGPKTRDMSPHALALGSAARHAVRRAASVLRDGGIAVLPTETFYALAADATNAAAVARLVVMKGRDGDKPLPLINTSMAAVATLAHIPERLAPLLRVFWPGPLTVVAPTAATLPKAITAGSGTVGQRISAAPFAQSLAQMAGAFVATSANVSGDPPVDEIARLNPIIGSGADLVVDGGKLPGGLPSTVVSWRNGALEILREGVIPAEALHAALAPAGAASWF